VCRINEHHESTQEESCKEEDDETTTLATPDEHVTCDWVSGGLTVARCSGSVAATLYFHTLVTPVTYCC